ncbi:hypothetical protein LWC34_37085 [Kibdelosporangium philippinense]|uniref:Uncharacterized protein n=2 Tax=Kibdelosporangium philippinense TaxID=211113 RepID=A0ABS8ZPI9_9PSEU|nr:hypothetical protein [Kibdelosporangium philippinense]MCE7008388.1 hypothetical protein [Kibdelosporangium philippinense]
MARKLALTCVLIAIAVFLPVPAGAAAERQQTAIPAYWGPDTPDGMTIFHRLAQNRPTNGIVVLNGSRSMPELPFHPAWASAIARLSATGTKRWSTSTPVISVSTSGTAVIGQEVVERRFRNG